MTATGKWVNVGSVFTDASTQLNNLANAGRAFGATVNNQTDLNRYADFHLLAKFASRPTSTSPYLNLYLIPALTGSQYVVFSTTTAPPVTTWAGTFPVNTATGPLGSFVSRVILPPLRYKAVLENKTGKALAATGTVLSSRAYN